MLDLKVVADQARNVHPGSPPGTAQACGWGSKKTQDIRYLVMKDGIGDVSNKSIVEIGCGDGAAIPFFCNAKEYYGWEIQPELLSFAQQREDRPRHFDFFHGTLYIEDIKSFYDVCIMSGVICYKGGGSTQEAKDHYYNLISTLLHHSYELWFNAPTASGDEDIGIMSYSVAELQEWIASWLYLLSSVKIVKGYLPHDITIGLKR